MTIVPIRGLFEAHLTVSDLDRSIGFYRDVLGLPLATRIPERQVAFFWVPTPEKAMLGLWSIGTSPLRMRLHIAFQVELPQVFVSVQALRARRPDAARFRRRAADRGTVRALLDAGGERLLRRSGRALAGVHLHAG